MIKGDVKISEPAINMQPQAVKKIETGFSTEDARLKTSAVETDTDKLDVKIRFARLKRRMRTRSSSIF
jgi:hypothetical protein